MPEELAAQLRETRGRLEDYLATTFDWLWETDERHRFTFTSDLIRDSGIDPNRLIGRTRWEFAGVQDPRVHPDWGAHLATLEARRPFRGFQYSASSEDDRAVHFEVNGTPIVDGSGAFCGYRGTASNITARKEAERRLAEGEARHRAVVEAALDCVIVMDGLGMVREFNPAAERVFGYQQQEVIGRKLGDIIVPPFLRAAHEAGLSRLLSTGRTRIVGQRIEVEGMRADGSIFPVELAIAEASTGKERLFVGYLRDITEQKRREAALAEAHCRLEAQNMELQAARQLADSASRAKSEFLAVMSHEIRTPMTAVLGMADLLTTANLSERERPYLEAIRSSGQHLLGVINDILDFSRIEAGSFELEHTDISIPEVLEQVRSLLAAQAAERGLELRFQLPAQALPAVRGDPIRLRQVLLNLVGNGLKFTHEGGVKVAVRHEIGQPPNLFRFEVQDTGIGIPSEQQAGLFRAFAQADSSTTRHYGGSGLGLAISRRLVEAMGGRIGIESEPGLGSLFWFEIPLELGEVLLATEQAAAAPTSIPPLHILLADDVELNQELLREMLGRHGHRVSVARNGMEAVGLATREAFDLVLMDVQMPVMNGVEATRRIRRLAPPAGTVPIVGLTADVMADHRRGYLEAGMDSCLSKPIAWPELFATLAAVAARPAALAGAGVLGEPRASASSLGSDEVALLDLGQLEVLRTGLPAQLWQSLLQRGIENIEQGCRELRRLPAGSEPFLHEAHSLKGTAGNFGLKRIAGLAAEIEAAARGRQDVTGLMERLAAAVVATGEELRATRLPTLP